MTRRARLAWLLFLLAPGAARARDDAPAAAHEPAGANDLAVPYAFYNEMFGAAGAFVYARDGFLQPQSQLIATGMLGTAGSGMVFLRAQDLLVPGFERLFVDPIFSLAYFHGDYAYVGGNPAYRFQQAGTNGSAYGNYVTGDGWDNYLRVSFRYLLPVGWGRDHVLSEYRLQEGLLVAGATGGESLNPFTSGRTFLEVRPFWRSLSLQSSGVSATQRTSGVDVSLIWDNRDFVTNPSVGQSVTLRGSRDPGRLDSTGSWTVFAGELDQYLSLGPSDWFRQRVVALDVWTADSPSWTYRPDGMIDHRSPPFAGANLGGIWRMRGYRFGRFSDKAGIYYAAEYRMIPRWNPFPRWPALQSRLGIDWIQLVPFAELGRVAPSWNLGELHSAMKWDLGFGLRFLAKGLVARIDFAGSREGVSVQMMVGQPFQF